MGGEEEARFTCFPMGEATDHIGSTGENLVIANRRATEREELSEVGGTGHFSSSALIRSAVGVHARNADEIL